MTRKLVHEIGVNVAVRQEAVRDAIHGGAIQNSYQRVTTMNNRNFLEELARNLRSAGRFQSLTLQRLPRVIPAHVLP